MNPELKKLLLLIASSINQLRGASGGGLSAEQDAEIEKMMQAIAALQDAETNEEATEQADVAAAKSATADLQAQILAITEDVYPRLDALEAAAGPATTGDAAAIEGELAPAETAAPVEPTPPADLTGSATPNADTPVDPSTSQSSDSIPSENASTPPDVTGSSTTSADGAPETTQDAPAAPDATTTAPDPAAAPDA